MALVELQDVVMRYDRVSSAPEVLKGVDLEIAVGASLAIVGPSGSGKSTILNIVGGLLPPTSGAVRFDGADVLAMDADALAAFRSRSVGFIFQSHHLLPQLSALENVLVPTLVLDAQAKVGAEARARSLLEDVGLADRTDHRPAQLSGGECQRVAVVRALINQPRLVLADEPTGQLDKASGDQLADLLAGLNERQGVALVTVTHEERLAARMQEVLVLEDGKLVAS
ncbi:MAG: ABC transporter ATP-binding protein [Planctomycetota bacterium]|nr:ABC transporter ATP-binding protein [Planctomycetota bacterium]